MIEIVGDKSLNSKLKRDVIITFRNEKHFL